MKKAKDLVGKFYSGLTTVKDAIEALDSKYTVDAISIGEAYENLSFVNAPVKVTVVETPKDVEDVKKTLGKANVDSVRMQGKNTVVFSVVTKGKMTESIHENNTLEIFNNLGGNWLQQPEDIVYKIYLEYGKNPNKYNIKDPEIIDIGSSLEVYHTRGISIPESVKTMARKKVVETPEYALGVRRMLEEKDFDSPRSVIETYQKYCDNAYKEALPHLAKAFQYSLTKLEKKGYKMTDNYNINIKEASAGWVGEFVCLSTNKDKYISCLGSDGVFRIDGRFSKSNAIYAAQERLAQYNKTGQKAVGFVLGKGEFRDVLHKDGDLMIFDADGRPTGKYLGEFINDTDPMKFRTVTNGLLSVIGEEIAFFRDNGRHARYGNRYSLWIAKSDSVPQGNDSIKPTVKTLTADTLNDLIDAVHSYVEGK